MIPSPSAPHHILTADSHAGDAPLVLIVDDDVAVRDILAWVVQSAGYEAVAAAGADGYRQLTELAERTALVLLDLTMQDMDGFRFRELQLAQAPLATVPTIVLSGGLVSAGDRERLRASAYVQKPMRLSELRATILQQARWVPGAMAPRPAIAAHTA
jgi:CheY-like chemotaxis protein